MKLPFLGPDGTSMITGTGLGDALDELCDLKGFVQLAAPYMNFPAHALERRGEELSLRVRLTQDFVARTLEPQPLRIRFPWGLSMVGGKVKILGFMQEEGKRILRVRVPKELVDEDGRGAIRLEPPTQASAMLSPDGESLVRAKVEDLSLLGVRVFALEPLTPAFMENQPLQLSLTMDQGPRLNLQARLVHHDGQVLGLAFLGPAGQPPLDPTARLELEAYLLPELEAVKNRWDNRAALRAAAKARAKPKAPPSGVLLLGRDGDLKAGVEKILGESLPVRHCAPALAPLRQTLEAPPKLILLQVVKGGVEERFLMRSLVEALPQSTPLVILGAPGVVGGRELAAEMKASTYVEWNPAQALFFSRLLQGLIRKRWGAFEE